MFIVTRIWISISDLDLNSIIESHNENLKNLLNFIIIIKMANGMGSFAFFGFISRPWHFWAHINYHCDPFDTRTPNFYFLGWFSDLFFWPKKRCAFWLRIKIIPTGAFWLRLERRSRVREPLHPASAGEGVMTFAWPIRITGQVLLAPPAVDVHYRHFAGMIDHPFVICLLPSFVYSS